MLGTPRGPGPHVPQLGGHLEGRGVPGPAGQAGPPGQGDADGGARGGPVPLPIPLPLPFPLPLLLRRPQLLEQPDALGLRRRYLGAGGGSARGQRHVRTRPPLPRCHHEGRTAGTPRGERRREGQDSRGDRGGRGGRAHPVSARSSREEQPPPGADGRHGGTPPLPAPAGSRAALRGRDQSAKSPPIGGAKARESAQKGGDNVESPPRRAGLSSWVPPPARCGGRVVSGSPRRGRVGLARPWRNPAGGTEPSTNRGERVTLPALLQPR